MYDRSASQPDVPPSSHDGSVLALVQQKKLTEAASAMHEAVAGQHSMSYSTITRLMSACAHAKQLPLCEYVFKLAITQTWPTVFMFNNVLHACVHGSPRHCRSYAVPALMSPV